MAIKIITEKTNLEVRNLKWIKFGKNTILFQTLLKKFLICKIWLTHILTVEFEATDGIDNEFFLTSIQQ